MKSSYILVLKIIILNIIITNIILCLNTNITKIYSESPNLIKNSSFEELDDNMPVNWKTQSLNNDSNNVIFKTEVENELTCVSLENINLNNSSYFQDVVLEINKFYK